MVTSWMYEHAECLISGFSGIYVQLSRLGPSRCCRERRRGCLGGQRQDGSFLESHQGK